MDNSYKTAISRRDPSAPARVLDELGLLKGEKLDYGCGRGGDADHYSMDRFDPYYFPDSIDGIKTYNTITCTYVLNVIEDEKERRDAVSHIRRLLKPNGVAYITVRRDIKEEGFTSKGTYQTNVELDLPVVKENSAFCIYRVGRD